jgi:hypothetical protein
MPRKLPNFIHGAIYRYRFERNCGVGLLFRLTLPPKVAFLTADFSSLLEHYYPSGADVRKSNESRLGANAEKHKPHAKKTDDI